MRRIVVIANNIRSCHNVGSLLRTAEGFGIEKVFLTGYTPYPISKSDERLPHLAKKNDAAIHKTALGAEQLVNWEYIYDAKDVIADLKSQGFIICALEQSSISVSLPDFLPPDKIAILLGQEVDGISVDLLKICDQVLEIPMFGGKESFNVTQAAAVALYHCRFK